jgi:hypothetical protein
MASLVHELRCDPAIFERILAVNAQNILPASGAATINEEPELAFEESIPLDGEDPVGEKMIEELGKASPKDSAAPTGERMPEQIPASERSGTS